MVEQDLVEQDLVEESLAEEGSGQSRTRHGCGAVSECVACARRGRTSCSMGRTASDAVIDDKTAAEKTWAD
jgi:hypothetical protein